MDITNKEMRDIAIYGAGGFGKEVACLIRMINESESKPRWNLIGFFDDNEKLTGAMISHFGTCLGGMDILNAYEEELDIVIAVGSPQTVRAIAKKITNSKVSFPNIIHPQTKYSDKDTFVIGKGNILQANCTMSCDVAIGDFNVLNGSVVFGHDVNVGSFNIFMPAVRVSGEVKVGDSNFFGVGSIILQQLKIGDSVRLAAGSVLMTKPKTGNLYMGVPAKKVDF